MNCAACGTENDVARKFCMECGAALARGCPTCGAPNPPRSKFCGECGGALEDTAAPATSPAPTPSSTERRLVSVLFLDLVSFTTISESRDAEDMRGLMDRYFETARNVIERHGGLVEKFIGDAVMAVWGTPVTYEDDAERSVRAALELVDAVASLGTAEGLALQARGGVLTGEAATSQGDIGNQGMVTGDTVNTASRLQSAAGPGEVFVGEATFRAASRAIAFEEVGALELKGKEEPVRAWRGLRVVAQRLGANRMTVEPPFVGRSEELRMLKELLHSTGREGKAKVVSVTGIGGIGKSRLAWELLKYIDGLSEVVWWHQGRCPAYGEGVTFWALGEMVRMRATIAETDPPGVSRTKLAASIAQHVPDEEERRWLEPRLAFLLGLGERPAGGGEELFAAWRAFFERISDQGLVVMVFEDLQWADTGLMDFIESVLEWSRAKPILVITLARPELVDRRPNWGAGQRSFVALHLEPLADEAMADLVRGLLPSASDDVLGTIVARAEGVPMYAVETIRMLADRGVLQIAEGVYEVVGELGEIQIPETLHALVASRLDALGPEDRSLLQDAAVLGKTFTLSALAAVSGADAATLEPRLLELSRKEFLTHEADPRSPERGQFGFVQSIIREVAYGMLSKADRRTRHLTAAHHFEAAGEDELAGMVAAHYVEALAATPAGPDADALAARARDALGLAADRATALGAPVQALTFAEQALAITPSGPERAGLLEQAARAAADGLRRDEQVMHLREAVDVWRAVGDVNAEAAAMGVLAVALGDLNKVDEVRSLVDQMRARLGDVNDELARSEFDLAMAYVQYFDEDLEGCLALIEHSLGGFERSRAWDRFRHAVGLRAGVLSLVGRHRESRLLRRGILAVATDENDLRAMAGALLGLGTTADESIESLELAMEAAAVARRGGYGQLEMTALANAVEGAVECGAWDTADGILADLRGRSDLPVDIADMIAFVDALLAAYRGDVHGAEVALGNLSEETTASPDHTTRSFLRRVRSVFALMAGDPDGAYREAMGAIEEAPGDINMPLAVWCAGRAALWLGDATKARAAVAAGAGLRTSWLDSACRSFEAGIAALEGLTREAVAGYEAVFAERLAKGDRFAHAISVVDAVAVLPFEMVPPDAFEAARSYLEELGAAPLLARLVASGVPATSGY